MLNTLWTSTFETGPRTADMPPGRQAPCQRVTPRLPSGSTSAPFGAQSPEATSQPLRRPASSVSDRPTWRHTANAIDCRRPFRCGRCQTRRMLIPLPRRIKDPASTLPSPLTELIGRERELVVASDLLRRVGVRLILPSLPAFLGCLTGLEPVTSCSTDKRSAD
jgi:hypothetical protein